jgi:sugar phosphate permease
MPKTLSPAQVQWRRRIFASTWLSYAGYYFCRKPFYIAKAELGADLGFDATSLGWIGSAFLISYTIGQFIAGAGGNRWGPRVILLVGMGASAVVNLMFGFTNSLATFMVLMTLNGLAQGTGWSGNVGSMANWFRRAERGTVMGLWATNYQVGGVAANTMAAFLLGAFGYRYAFFCGSAVLILVLIFFAFNQRDKPEDLGLDPIVGLDEIEPSFDATPTSWDRTVVINIGLVGVFYFFIKFIRYTIWSWTPYMLSNNYGLSGADAGYLSTTFDLAGIAGVIAAGWLSDKFFDGRRAKISFLFVLAIGVSCMILYYFGSVNLWMMGISLGLVGFFLYGPDALMTGAGAIEVADLRRATLAAGVINGMGSVGSVAQEFMVGPVLAGAGPTAVFSLLLAASGGAVVSMGILLNRNRTGKADL